MPAWTRAQRWAFFAVTALAAALRFHTLGEQPFWSDEWYTLKMADQPHWFQTVLMCLVTDLYPPLVFLCTRLSLAFGHGLVQLRFFSFLGGVAAVALVFVIARRWAGTRAAVYAGLLAALSPMGVYYSQELKLYSFFAATNLWVLYEALASLESATPRWKRLALAVTVSMYSYYLLPYLLLPLYLAALWVWWQGRREGARSAAKGMSVGLLLGLPLLPFFVKTVMIFSASFWDAGKHLLLWYSAQNYSTGFVAPPPVAVAAALLFMVLIAGNFRRKGPGAWLVGVMVAFAVVPALAQFVQTWVWKPSYTDRSFLGAAYGWALVAGLGAAALPRALGTGLLAAALAVNAYSLKLHYDPATRSRFDFSVPYDALKKDWRSGDVVFHKDQQSLFPFAYHARLDQSGMPNYEWVVDPGSNFNPAVQKGRLVWQKFNGWLKQRGWGIDSGIDPLRVFGPRLDQAVETSQRLWMVAPKAETLRRAWNPQLNLWRNGYLGVEVFDPAKETWMKGFGFKLKEKRELSPGVDLYLYERKK